MAIKHNQQIPNNHFHKDWQRRVRVHFDQAGRKQRRRQARLAKASAVAPRPVDKLRPVVRCPTIKYNRRVRAGRGFTLRELKEASIPRKLAPTIGIPIDWRRQNLSQESLSANVARLKAYIARLILFPRKSGQHKHLDSSKEQLEAAKDAVRKVGAILQIDSAVGVKHGISEVKRGEMPENIEAYRTLRDQRSEARLVGVREKRAKQKADEAEAKKGK